MPGAVSDERVSHADQRAELRQLAQQGPSRSPARLAVCAALLLGCWVCVSDIARRSPTRTALVGEDIPLSAMMGGDSLDVFGNPSDDIKPPPKPPATSFSLPATGSFTGHSHSVPGGPFTIGSGTYFNFLDPQPDRVLCIPGTVGLGGKLCKTCPRNAYCSGGVVQRDCPANTYSIEGSYKKSHCRCAPGFYGSVGTAERAEGCAKCPANHHCPGGMHALPCPAHAVSDVGALVCKCVEGYFNNELGECQECLPGFWCPGGGLINACPDHSNSTRDSIKVSDCACVPGFFQPWPQDDIKDGDGPHCVACYAGAFCPGGELAVPCTSNAVSVMGASTADACVCRAGYFGEGSSACQLCEAGYFCPGGRDPVACPEHSVSDAGATAVSECTCKPGYAGKAGACTLCPAGSFCPGGDTVLHCPAKSTSDEGAIRCRCAPGFRGSDPFMCMACPADEYCPGGGQEAPCPANSQSGGGAKAAHECACDKGFTGTGGSDCGACPVNTYCPTIGGDVRDCPANSVSVVGSTAAQQCTCKDGYYNRRGYTNALAGPDCQLCPAGSFCPGGEKKKCPAKMTSQVGSESIDDCRCAPGHFRDGDACSVCPAGHWCAGNADKEPCPGVSTSDVGAVSDQDCKCMPGQYGDPKDENGCLPCDAGYFCSGGTAKTECPVGSMSAAGMTECRCAAGYFGSNWRHCNDCPKNQFCPGGSVAFQCPANAEAPAKSTSVADCQCISGFMPVTSANTDLRCEKCAEGSFCPGKSVVRQCPAGKTSNPGASTLRGCGCSAGYFDSGVVPKSNFAWAYDGKVRIENGGLYKWCILSSDGSRLTINGAVAVNNDGIHTALKRCADLQMEPGLAGVRVEGFQAVGKATMQLTLRGPDTDNKNIYPESEIYESSRGGGEGWRVRVFASDHLLVRIPDMSTLQLLGEAETKRIEMKDASEFDDLIPGSCAVCRKGHFCPGAFPTSSDDPKAREIACPGRRFSSHSGAADIRDCDACKPGFYGTDWRHCTACPADHYCPGGDLSMRCPSGAVTRGRRKHNIRHCVCDKGYEPKAETRVSWECELCRSGYFCPAVGKGSHVCPGNSDSPTGSTSIQDCKCDPGQYDVGSTCKTCEAGYFCVGDGKRQFCGPNADGPAGATAVGQCKAADADVFAEQYEGRLPTCKRVKCQKTWLGNLMRRCKNSESCRGVFMETGKFLGWGCMAVGLQSCLSDLASPDDAIAKTFYAKRADLQAKDSVALMRQMQLPVPECQNVGQPAVFHQFCAPHSRFRPNAWKAILHKGSWSHIGRKSCDDDEQLCSVSQCNLPKNSLSSVDIPPGLEVHLYSQPDFKGDEIILYGSMDADDKCLGEERRGTRRHWNNAVESIKLQDSNGPPPAPPPAPFKGEIWSLRSQDGSYPLGKPERLPDFSRLGDPQSTIESGFIDLNDKAWSEMGWHDNFAARWTGLLVVKAGGTYKFFTESDDGSKLYVNGDLVVDNDGLHGPVTRDGTVDLEAGEYEIKVLFFEHHGGADISVKYAGPDTEGKTKLLKAQSV